MWGGVEVDVLRASAIVFGIGLLMGVALWRRGLPTVWSTTVVAGIGVGAGGLFAAAARFHPAALVGGLGLALLALVTRWHHPRDFLVLFARSDVRDRAISALDRLGIAHVEKGDDVSIERPRMHLHVRRVVANVYWVSVHVAEETPKTRLITGVLRKLLSN